MLYNGAIKFAKQAKLGLENKDFQEANNKLQRTQAIISELMINLDREKGGEIAN